MSDDADRRLQAFRRLLANGSQGNDEARTDALAALCFRTVWVPTWGEEGAFRTLVNSNGESALPVFTGRDTLEHAARRFGWQAPGQQVVGREVDARDALQHALGRGIQFVVVDIAEEHALEVEHAELPRVLADAANRLRTASTVTPVPPKPAPPGQETHFAGGSPKRISSAPPPAREEDPAAPPPPGSIPEMPAAPAEAAAAATAAPGGGGGGGPTTPGGGTAQATFGSGAGVTVQAWPEPPGDELVKALASVFREYPEVEWASLVMAARGPTEARPTVALRLMPDYRARVAEILKRTREAAEGAGATLDTLLADEATLMRRVRAIGLAIYPWRSRKATRPGHA